MDDLLEGVVPEYGFDMVGQDVNLDALELAELADVQRIGKEKGKEEEPAVVEEPTDDEILPTRKMLRFGIGRQSGYIAPQGRNF